MGNASFNQDWYGMQAKVLAQSDDRVVVDYGCKGRGIVKNYNLFEGIQLCFLDFESDESMETQKFNPDIIQITHCQTGRYECEFANHTVSYLPEGYFSVAATEHLPVSFSFPLGKYYGVSLVIDRQALSDGTRRMMQTIPIDLDKIGTTLRLETRWYVSDTPAQLKHLFSELYSAAETEPIGYFKIKANFLCVKCCRLRSDRTFHANKSRGLFTIHHLYLIVRCAIAHINNHETHIV